ncbi:MAG: HAMP domain-containing histidine kinase, partial [Myxococcales bacterium]|nr:HAMP domain-containing histidine kinase [Myxococcales bacterium]
DLRRELADLLDFLAQEHQRNRVSVVRELGREGVWVDADAGQLRQAVLNLLRNAQEAVLEHADGALGGSDLGDLLDDLDQAPGGADASAVGAVGTITVSLTCKKGAASVFVTDSGGGIPTPEGGDLDQIFEAFVTSKAHGTGLGLPMVQQIAVDHGGGVRLLETGPQGTRFEFRLPACDPPAPSVSSPNSA